jgi:hypothetical protein
MAIPTTVILHHRDNRSIGMFNYQIAKPFLPEDIRSLIDRIRTHPHPEQPQPATVASDTSEGISGGVGAVSPSATATPSRPAPEPDVLDAGEIDTIRSLLEGEGLEIVGEEEWLEPTPAQPTPAQPSAAAAPLHATAQAPRPAGETGEEMLFKMVKKCKPKQIRQLLKGATVRIEITFPKAP